MSWHKQGTSENDNLDLGDGVNIVSTDAGDDTVHGGDSKDIIRGGSGNDTLYGGGFHDVIRGDSGDDTIYGGEGNDTLLGDSGDDEIYGGEGDDHLLGGSGNDSLTGGAGSDTFLFSTNTGNDTVEDFDLASDVIDLSRLPVEIAFSDLTITNLEGQTEGLDVAEIIGVTITHSALGGTITLLGVEEADLTESMFNLPDGSAPPPDITTDATRITHAPNPWVGDGNANFFLSAENDKQMYGEGGNDLLYGGEGDDELYGGAGNDWLVGEEGDDTIDGGAGGDTIFGGSGADTFVFQAGHGDDTIKDFEDETDTIDLSAMQNITGFGDLTITADSTTALINTSEGGGTIRLENTEVSELSTDDFTFYEEPPMDGI